MFQLIAYLAAVLGTLLIGGGLIVALEIARPGGEWNSNTTTVIVGMATTILAVLLNGVRSTFNAKAINETAKEVQAVRKEIDKGVS